MNTQKEYEVIKFIEHNGRYRVVMDCEQGRLLIDRVLDPKGITKQQVFKWIEKLILEVERFEQAKDGQCYRYLNPYTVVVTQSEEVFLLDLTAQNNREILKNVQKPQLREHFIKPLISLDKTRPAADLFVLGKTIQFVMSYTNEFFTLTRHEEYLLSDLIERCLELNSKKKFENIKQMRKYLLKITDVKLKKQKRKMIIVILTIVTILLGLCSVKSFAHENNTEIQYYQEEIQEQKM